MGQKLRTAEEGLGTGASVFDREHLAHYAMDNPDLEREIVSLFVAQLPSMLGLLLTAKSAEEWRFATHTLKGSAQAIGASRIGEIASALEPASCFQQTKKRTRLLAGLQAATQEFNDLARQLYR